MMSMYPLVSIGSVLVAMLAGAMSFFTLVIAPLIFIKLEPETAGRFVRAVFPWYYLIVIVTSLLAALLIFATWPLNATLLALVSSSAAYCRQALMPAINQHRDAVKAGDATANSIFNRLHRRSEIINTLQLLAIFAVVLHLSLI